MAELYNIETGLSEAMKFRRRRDAVSRAQVTVADRLANHLLDHFGPEAEETAGLALVVGAASVAAVAIEDMPPAVIVNILALAGQRLVTDSREAAREVEEDRTRDAAGLE